MNVKSVDANKNSLLTLDTAQTTELGTNGTDSGAGSRTGSEKQRPAEFGGDKGTPLSNSQEGQDTMQISLRTMSKSKPED